MVLISLLSVPRGFQQFNVHIGGSSQHAPPKPGKSHQPKSRALAGTLTSCRLPVGLCRGVHISILYLSHPESEILDLTWVHLCVNISSGFHMIPAIEHQPYAHFCTNKYEDTAYMPMCTTDTDKPIQINTALLMLEIVLLLGSRHQLLISSFPLN